MELADDAYVKCEENPASVCEVRASALLLQD